MQLLLQQMANGIAAGAVYAVVAVGFGLIFSVMRVINFAHPDLFMIGAYCVYLTGSGRLGISTRMLACSNPDPSCWRLLATGALGLPIERTAIRPLRDGASSSHS